MDFAALMSKEIAKAKGTNTSKSGSASEQPAKPAGRGDVRRADDQRDAVRLHGRDARGGSAGADQRDAADGE